MRDIINSFMGLFTKDSGGDLTLILDIGSGSIGGALILKNKKGAPTILNTERKFFKPQNSFDELRVRKEMLETLDVVCVNLQKKVGTRPHKIYCILGTPWSHGELRAIELVEKKDFKFTEKFAQKLIAEEVGRFKKSGDENLVIIDQKTTKVALNGYNIEKPHGERARTLRLDVFLSVSSKDLAAKIEEKIHKTFKAQIAFTSQMFSDFIVVRDIFELQNDFLIINAGGEATDVVLIKDDHLVGTASFPFGHNSIIRLISKSLGKTLHETKSVFSLMRDGHMEVKESHAIARAIKSAASIWINNFKGILSDLAPTRHVPHNLFLISDDKTYLWLQTLLNNKSFPEFTTAHGEFNVIIGDNRILHSFCHFAEGAERDAALTIKTIFINQV